MTKKSACKCSMNKSEVNTNSKDIVFKSKPCCDEMRKEISNTSDFDNHKKIVIDNSSAFINIDNDNFTHSYNSDIPDFKRLIIYKLSRDIPILYSKFQI